MKIFGILILNFLCFKKTTTTVKLDIIPIEDITVDKIITISNSSGIFSKTVVIFADTFVVTLAISNFNHRIIGKDKQSALVSCRVVRLCCAPCILY